MRKIVLVVLTMFFVMFGTVVFAAGASKQATKPEALTTVKTETPSVIKSEIKTEDKAGVKIGVIDLNQVLLKSPQLTLAKEDFKKKFEAREKAVAEAQKKFHSAIETFSKNSPTMKADVQKEEQQKIIDQQKKLQEMQAKLQEEESLAQNNVMKDIMKKVESIVDKVAADKQFDIIVAKAGLAYNKKELEITDEVISQLKKK